MYMHSAEIIAIVMVLLFYLVILGGTWVLVSFGPYRMAKHAGIPRHWLALLPVGNAWILGLLAERSVYAHTQRPRRLAFWNTLLQALPLASLVLLFPLALADWDFNPLIGISLLVLVVSGLVGIVMYYYCIYHIFKDYAPDNALLYLLLGIFFNIYWIFFLVEMNTVPVSVTGFGTFPGGRPKYDRYHQWNQGFAAPGYPPPGYGPQGAAYTTNPGQQTYTTNPGQQTYTTNPGQQTYQGQGPQFYQGQGSYYQPPAQPPYDPSRNFPSGGYDPQNPPPPERQRGEDEGRHGPEL